MTHARAFLGLGSNDGDPRARLAAALAALDRDGLAVAGAARLVRGPFVGGPAGAAPVVNTVAEIRTSLAPHALLERLQAIERAEGRVRDGRAARTLDLDLLAYEDVVLDEPDLVLPHPRACARAFVLAPWVEVAPLYRIPGTDATVVEHAAALARDEPEAEAALRPVGMPPYADRGAAVAVLHDQAELDAWRDACEGTVGVVMTMGALHEGHGALVQRAVAECDAVVATIFVNPTQFAPGEDLARYPRTFEDDVALLGRHGARAVYAPRAEEIYPDGPRTTWEPSGAALGYEGAVRPEHFAGVATVVTELWRRTRAHRSYFGRKDAQQLAVLRQVRRELDLPVEVVACPLVRALDALALSSRNRYLAEQERLVARELSATLDGLWAVAARGVSGADGPRAFEPARDLPAFRAHLAARGLAVDYLDLVDPDTMAPQGRLDRPLLAMAAVRLGAVRLLDNRWLAPPAGGAA